MTDIEIPGNRPQDTDSDPWTLPLPGTGASDPRGQMEREAEIPSSADLDFLYFLYSTCLAKRDNTLHQRQQLRLAEIYVDNLPALSHLP